MRLAVLGLLSAIAFVSACVDGRSPTEFDSGIPAYFQILTTFRTLGSSVQTGEINHIRVTVLVYPTDSVLTVFTQDVDPNATVWQLEIPVEIEDNTSLEVELIVELIFKNSDGSEVVQWSGRTLAQVSAGQSNEVKQVEVYRGPTDNLDIESVTITDPAIESLIESDTVRLEASVQGGGSSTQIFWGSLDEAVATVDGGGLVTTLAPGTARIAAVAGPRADTVSITVIQAITAVELAQDSVLIDALGDTVDLGARVIDPRGETVSGAHLEYEVGDSTIVQHLGDGVFVALANGLTEVTVIGSRTAPTGEGVAPQAVVADTAVRATATIIVAQAAAEIQLDRDSLAFSSIGDTTTLVAAALDEAGSPVDSAVIVWEVTDSSVVSVSEDGLVTTEGNGMAFVLATSGEASDSARVRVRQVAMNITVEPELDTLTVRSEELQLEVEMTDSLESPMLDTVPEWTSSDTMVVSVDSTGLVIAVGTGTAEVVAMIDSIADTATVVVRFSAGSVVIDPVIDTLRSLGATRQFTAVVLDDQGDTIPDRPVTWAVSDTALATVDSTGLVTSVANGPVDVIATSDEVSKAARLIIRQELFRLGIAPAPDTINDGDTLVLTAEPVDSLGSPVSGLTALWESEDPSVALVAPLDSLNVQVIAVDTGTVEIVARIEGLLASKFIVVLAGIPVRIDVRPDSTSVRSGRTVTMAAVPVDARDKETRLPDTLTVVWSSLDTSVVAVSTTGVATGRNVGRTYVKATAGSFVDSSLVSVTPGTATSLEFLNPVRDTTVSAGDTVAVQLEGHDARGNFIDSGWTLSAADPSVVAVIGDSAFVGQRADSTTLTATLDGATASIRVAVVHGDVRVVTLLRPSADTTMTAGGAVPLQAEARDFFGNLVPRTFAFTSGAPATVRISGDTAYAEQVGVAQVAAATDGLADTVGITVVHGSAVTLAFSNPAGDTVTLGILDSLATAAAATDALGNAFSDGITYVSRNTAAATVDAAGLVVANSVAGQSTWIVASRDAAADSFLVKVAAGQLAKVDLLPEADTARAIGDTMTFVLLPLDRANNPVFGASYTFTLADGTVAGTVRVSDTTIVPDGTFATMFPDVAARYPGLANADSINVGLASVLSLGNGVTTLAGQGEKLGLIKADTSAVVVAVEPSTATLTPDTVTLTSLGDSVTFTPTARDANDNVIPGEAFTFTSSNPSVATIDADGVAVAVGNGAAVITATTSNGIQATSGVTVQQVVSGVTVTPASGTASSFGDTLVFKAQALDARGSQVAGATYSWDFQSQVTVGPQMAPGSLLTDGDSAVFVAQSNGSDVLLATSSGVTNSANVVVSQKPAVVAVTPDSIHFTSLGEGGTYRGGVTDARGSAVQGATYLWTLSGTSVQINGAANADSVRVTAVGNGLTTVTLEATRDGVSAQGSAKGVLAVTPAVVTLTPDTATLTSVGDSLTMTATASDANENVIVGEPFTFTSSNTSVATIDGNGVVVAAANGTTTITATTSNGISETSTITVQQVTTNVTVTPASGTASSFGDTLVFKAQALDARGSQVAGATYAWDFQSQVTVGPQMAPGSLFTAGDSAVFVAQSNGSDVLLATSSGVTNSANVVVSQKPAGVTITPDSIHFTSVGEVGTYRSSVADARGNAVVGATYLWTLDGTTVVQFNGGTSADTARVTSVGNGAATVTLQATRDGVSAQNTAKAVVAAVPASITIMPDTATLTAKDQTIDLSGRVTVADANANEILGVTPTWSTLDATIVTVNSSGVVTALNKNGSAGVVATVNGLADTATVTVDITPGSVDVTPDFATSLIAGATPYSAVVRDGLGNLIDMAASWSSTNASVATVDSQGSATGVSAGVVGVVGTASPVGDTATLAVLGPNSLLSTVFVGGQIRSEVQPGSAIQVPVKLDMSRVGSDGDLGSLEFTVTYDAAVLQYDSASVGVSGTADVNHVAPDTVKFGVIALDPQGTADLTLATLHFTVKSVADGTVTEFLLNYPQLPTKTSFEYYESPLVVNGRLTVTSTPSGPPGEPRR